MRLVIQRNQDHVKGVFGGSKGVSFTLKYQAAIDGRGEGDRPRLQVGQLSRDMAHGSGDADARRHDREYGAGSCANSN